MQGLDPVRIESPMTEGNPDVNYLCGWIELKYAHRWPTRPLTPLRLPHFTKAQRAWLTRRAHAGGCAFLLLQVGGNSNEVGEEWLLFHGATAYLKVGKVDRQTLYLLACARWTRRPTRDEIQKWLARPPSFSRPISPNSTQHGQSALSSGAVGSE